MDYSIRGEVVFNKGLLFKRTKNIYWQYHETETDCVWITAHVVATNGMALDVRMIAMIGDVQL